MYRVIAILIGYLLGGIQSAVLYSRIKGLDIREHGSGNAGATNTLRVLGKKAALIVFVCDLLKAIVAVIVAKLIFKDHSYVAALYAGLGAILGHSYPMFFGFKGGKGIAVTVGAIYFIDVRIGLMVSIVFLVSAYFTKIVSISSLLLTACVPVGIILFHRGTSYFVEAVVLGILIALLTAYRHKDNIKRLLKGTESKIGQKKQ